MPTARPPRWARASAPEELQRHEAANDAPDADDDVCLWPVRHVIVPAAGAAPPRTKGPSSVFALGELAKTEAANSSEPSQADRRRARRRPQASTPPPIKVERQFGSVKVVRLRPEETEEWAERERQRRAKQRPPKPTRFAKSKSVKLRQFIRFSGDDWDA